MDIYEFYMRCSINGIPRSTLRDILRYMDMHLTVKAAGGRLKLVPKDEAGEEKLNKLSKSRIIKCTMEYYKKPGENKPNIKTKNMFLACDRIRDYLGISTIVARDDCRSCHLHAMEKARAGEIQYK